MEIPYTELIKVFYCIHSIEYLINYQFIMVYWVYLWSI